MRVARLGGTALMLCSAPVVHVSRAARSKASGGYVNTVSVGATELADARCHDAPETTAGLEYW